MDRPQPVSQTRRRFADLRHGQMHYREAGQGRTILLIHASPGSARQLGGLISGLAETCHVVAPDTPGNGDSDALDLSHPGVTDLAAAMLEFMDAADLGEVFVYGSHTGACVAAELAILAPNRVIGIVADGVLNLSDEMLQEYLEQYAHPFPADLDGTYLQKAFLFCRDQYVFFPWYKRSAEARRPGGLGSAKDLKDWVVDVLKASETYHLNYRAAFRWKAAERLRQVKVPLLLVASESDPLLASTREIAGLVEAAGFADLPPYEQPDFAARRLATLRSFLDACPASSTELTS
ncbi:MAG: alpha/beta hydrolase [Pseudomonadota bacterium]|nr:alpha/beta hydrolase [Pseudomonadota bacterium]